jgi:hypothetical protein
MSCIQIYYVVAKLAVRTLFKMTKAAHGSFRSM